MSESIKAMLPFAYFKNNIVPQGEARIAIASHSLQYGTLCFSGMRGYAANKQARIIRLRDHYERLMNSVKILGIDFYIEFEPFQSIISELIKKNAPGHDFYIRPFIFCDDEVLGPCIDGRTYHLAVYLLPLSQYFKRQGGLRMMISSHKKFSDSSLSTKAKASGCYLNSALATSEARRAGYDEALMINDEGLVVEASVANLFIVYRGEIMTPPLGLGPLEGITLRTIIELFKDEGINVSFAPLDRSMVLTADEVFITGSAAQVSYVEMVNGRPIGPGLTPTMGPICQKAQELFSQVISMEHPRSKQWMSVFAY